MATIKAKIIRESAAHYRLTLFQCPKCIRGKAIPITGRGMPDNFRSRFRGIRCNARGCNFRVLEKDKDLARLHWNHHDLRDPQPKPLGKRDDLLDAKAYLMKIEWHDATGKSKPADRVNSPAHYTADPSGVECISITRHRNFNVGNAIKYLWRAGLKDATPANQEVGGEADNYAGQKHIEDLNKALWYICDEVQRLQGAVTCKHPALRIHSQYTTEQKHQIEKGG